MEGSGAQPARSNESIGGAGDGEKTHRLRDAKAVLVTGGRNLEMTLVGTEVRMMRSAANLWWAWLVAGIIWVIVSLIILQFDTSSATTIGIIAGVMFLVAGLQSFMVGAAMEGWKWMWFLFGAILVVGGIVALVYPERTFLIVANILGFMFALTGVFWMIQAFVMRGYDNLWWVTLITGILMIVLGFWLGGQLIGVQAATLLVFTGFWALFRGILDIISAFQLKHINDQFDDLGDAVHEATGV